MSKVANLRAARTAGDAVLLEWKSGARQHEIDYRAAGQAAWQTIRNVWAQRYNIIMLRPETDYEFRVRPIVPEASEPDGRVRGTGLAESATVCARTAALAPRIWKDLSLWPTRHLDTFADVPFHPGNEYHGAVYPCIEYFDGFCYIVETFYIHQCQGPALYLSKVCPDDCKVLWTKEIVPANNQAPTYQGVPATCLLDHTLYVTWNWQNSSTAAAWRQRLLGYDLKTGACSEPIILERADPGCGAHTGGIAVFQGKLWLSWVEVGRARNQIVLRSCEDGRFGAFHVFGDCPSVSPYAPYLGAFDGQLIMFWSDLAALGKDSEHEPLYCTFFDGERFSKSVKVQDKGRSRYAKGIQRGDSFYCFYKCSTRYPGSQNMYHDIALTRIGPAARDLETTWYVDDMKYNSCPDVTRVDDSLFVVYTKYEHGYHLAHDPAINHGAFIGKITAR
ncbi:MAG: fibronectin type III domain-containing protein [Lentisphaerae bacterium]|nr:fibronectin type III domain-containing protein [Lentisphaerota bacterium]